MRCSTLARKVIEGLREDKSPFESMAVADDGVALTRFMSERFGSQLMARQESRVAEVIVERLAASVSRHPIRRDVVNPTRYLIRRLEMTDLTIPSAGYRQYERSDFQRARDIARVERLVPEQLRVGVPHRVDSVEDARAWVARIKGKHSL